MPINPETIRRFLEANPPWVPAFKGAPIRTLRGWIHDFTGEYARPKTPPFALQWEALAAACWMRRLLLFYEPRTGKSKAALDWAEHMRVTGAWGRGKGLVLAHAPSGVDVWEGEIAKHSDLEADYVRSGPAAQEELLAALDSEADLIVIAPSTMQTLFSEKRLNRKKQPKLYPDNEALAILAEQITLAIFDEIHQYKDPQSLRFQLAALATPYANLAIGLTGTPVGRDPFNLWAQAYLVDKGETLGEAYHFFLEAFRVQASPEQLEKHRETERRAKRKLFNPAKVPTFDKAKLPILKEKLASISIVGLLTEVMEVNVVGGQVPLRMRGDVLAAYNRTIDEMVQARIDDLPPLNNFVKLRQIASGIMPFADDDGTRLKALLRDNIKAEWLADTIADLPADLPILIFHEFIPSAEIIVGVMTKAGRTPAILNGQTKDKDAVADYKAGRRNTLIANVVKGSMALDLPTTEWLVFYESPTSPVVRKQCEGRPLARAGRPLIMDDLVCSPVERRILALIKEGKDMAHSVLQMRSIFSQRA